MKKKIILSFFITIAALLIMGGAVSATTINNNYYKYTIPNKYEESYKNVTDTSSYISYNAYEGDCYSTVRATAYKFSSSYLKPYTEKDMNNHMDRIKKIYEKNESSTLTGISGSLVELNGVKGYKILYYDKTTYSSGTTYNFGYVIYELRSDNYEYTFGIGSNKSFVTSSSAKNMINSFKVKDTVLRSRNIPFVDVPTKSWYYDAVKYVYSNDMVAGLNAYTYGPNNKLTRGQLVTILYRMENMPSISGSSKFKDVKDSKKFYYKAVLWASKNKIVSGYSNGNFGPTDNITRQDLAVIFKNYATYKKKNVSKTNNLSGFKDKSKVSNYALPAMKWAVGSGVITGNSKTKTLNPKGNATRAEVAAMIQKYCINVGR